jgi:hypothetical protein
VAPVNSELCLAVGNSIGNPVGNPWAAVLRGKACNNPTVYFLLYLVGDVPEFAAAAGFLATIAGTVIGTFAYALALEKWPLPGRAYTHSLFSST